MPIKRKVNVLISSQIIKVYIDLWTGYKHDIWYLDGQELTPEQADYCNYYYNSQLELLETSYLSI